MSVNPGFGGQKFIPETLNKLRAARARLDAYEARSGRRILLEIDGGVKTDNIAAIARAGADTFVAGSAVFGAAKAADPHRYDSILGALRAELAAARAVAPSTTSPWARLDRLAAVLRPGQTIAWSVSSGDPWAASAHALDGAGTVDAWTGEGATPDEAIAALVAAVEGEATARVEAIRAAMEGRS